MQHLEMHMRSELPPLCGRDHMSYRSTYYPIKVQCNNELRMSIGFPTMHKLPNPGTLSNNSIFIIRFDRYIEGYITL